MAHLRLFLDAAHYGLQGTRQLQPPLADRNEYAGGPDLGHRVGHLVVALSAKGQDSRTNLVAVPEITLQAAEAAVQERVRSVRAELEELLARPDVPDSSLAQAFGEASELFLVYDLAEAARACLRNAVSLAPETMRWHYLLATLDELEARRRAEASPPWLTMRRAAAILVLGVLFTASVWFGWSQLSFESRARTLAVATWRGAGGELASGQ